MYAASDLSNMGKKWKSQFFFIPAVSIVWRTPEKKIMMTVSSGNKIDFQLYLERFNKFVMRLCQIKIEFYSGLANKILTDCMPPF